MTRLFFAVPVEPTPELRHLARQLELLGPALRVTSRDQWHFTVKFLGDTPEDRVPLLKEICAELAAACRVTEVGLSGLGVFPHLARPQVVWCGLRSPEPLIELAERLEIACAQLGIPPDRRAFHPHLTLARINTRPPQIFREFIESRATIDLGETTLSKLVLFQSVLSPSGSKYTPLMESPWKKVDR